MLAMTSLMVGAATGLTSCKEDDDYTGEPFFRIEGSDDCVVHIGVNGLAQTSWAFSTGEHRFVRANGKWQLIPVNEEDSEWMRVYPLEGEGEGILRFYAIANPVAEVRTAEFRVLLNGVEQPQHLVLAQDACGPVLNLSADILQLQQSGGSQDITISANYEWEVEADPTAPWCTVTRVDDTITIGTTEPNHTGADRTAAIIIRGTGDNYDVTKTINVTQMNAYFFDDFSWVYNPGVDLATDIICYSSGTRLDKIAAEVANNNPGWTGVGDINNEKVLCGYAYARYHFVVLGTLENYIGNMCSPKLDINGTVNATVSFSMAGFCTKKNVRDGNEFWVALLGPGRITGYTAGGTSTGEIMTGNCSIPYTSTGEGTNHDVDLTEAARFFIGSTGYFDTGEPTGLQVWNSPDVQFSINVEGMTKDTRVVFISCDADKVTMLNGWIVSNGLYISGRKCFGSYKVVID